MCGIFGIIGNGQRSIDPVKVGRSARQMHHRGPNAYGQWGVRDRVELAHLRLSIVDLSTDSNQPFISACERYILIFNGEIYNYIELRNKLQAIGYKFRTSGDTEVLLNAYRHWGEKCVSYFNGDWAFAVYDRMEHSLFCSRDRFGVKPFNYTIVENELIFASEIKSILEYDPKLSRPNYNVIGNYIRNGLGAQNEDTWFSGIKRLPPAHNLIWRNGKVTMNRYWEYPTQTTVAIRTDDAVETYRQLFTNAVKLRMRSDVPVGTTLSSGLDSSSIVAILRTFFNGAHKTFTATFDPRDLRKIDHAVYKKAIENDESQVVRRLAGEFQLEPYFIPTTVNHFVDELTKIIWHLESGHSSPATVPLSRTLSKASEHVTVIMEGQGADELLAGYVMNMLPPLLYELCRVGEFSQAWKEFQNFSDTHSLGYTGKVFMRLLNSQHLEELYLSHAGVRGVFGAKLREYQRIRDYPQAYIKFSERFNQMLYRAHSGGLVNLLHYGDALSMAYSLESRLPFVDVNLVEFSFRLPYWLKIRDGLGKHIHRQAMVGILPEYIVNNKVKYGFNTPLSVHFGSLSSQACSILLSEQCLERGLFDREGLQAVITNQIEGRKDNATFLFRLLSVELWFRQFIDN